MFLRVPIEIDLAVVDITEALAHVREKCFRNVIIEIPKRHFFRRYDTHPAAIELDDKSMRHARRSYFLRYLELGNRQIMVGSIRSSYITWIWTSRHMQWRLQMIR